MGVPKFFRYISERYPNLSELVGSAELPQFDNMYLDMNGIIHVCSHPDDSNVHFRMSEEQMFRDILHYIDTLFHMIQPRKLFFMAVDGVAPRAKMNQQRSRRFQSARTALELIEKAKKANEKLPEESRFDSNCITPGTIFMERLQQAFKHFVKLKLSTDPAWQHCRVILSGHETPGEGEHKIMEYIRYLKAQSSYDPNTRHCLYGLDADLIMLGLCTHEPNFALLREEVKFDKNAKRAPSVDETKFYLLHLGLLREYLELEFIELKPALSFEYDLEKIIDDWIFMCFMVGNDFLPHLPNLHINSNALPILYKVYKTVLPQLDGYMNEVGKLNLKRFEVFMGAMSDIDRDLFRERYEDLQYMESKRNDAETFGTATEEITAETKTDLDELIRQTNLDFGSGTSSSDDSGDSDSEGEFMFDGQEREEVFKGCEEEDELSDDELFEKEFKLHKRDYYINKLKYPEMTEEVLAEQTKCYITALQWTLGYYYRGVCSWSWYYPHHYAPYISDISNFAHLNLDFALGKPFLPFEQLLSVLPAASKELLPKVYHSLMTDPNSKIIDYYPVDFETDLNGKKQEWEALVLIPFINEMRLMDAMNDCNDKLSEHERIRNSHGPMLQYDYCATNQGSQPECLGQQMIGHVFCKETKIDRSEIIVPEDKLVLGPCPRAQKDVYFPGFPTMRHLKHSGKLETKRVKVFHQPTRNESMIIKIDEKPPHVDIQTLAQQFIDKEIYVGWPHLREAKVCGVSDANTKIEKTGIEVFDGKNGNPNSNSEFKLLVKHVKDHHLTRLGVDLGETDQLLHVYPLLNREYLNTGDGKLTLSKNWSKIPLAIAPISVVQNVVVFAKDLENFKRVEDVFTKNSTVFLMNKGYYGCQSTILDEHFYNGRIKLTTTAHPVPDFTTAKQLYEHELHGYVNAWIAGSQSGVSSHLFNRITGIVFIYYGERRYPVSDNDKKINVGLQFKHFKQNEEVPGYTKSFNNQWLYSQETINVVQSYAMKFPQLFQLMNKQGKAQSDPIFESDLNADKKEDEENVLKQIQQWLKGLPCRTIARQPCGTQCLSRQAIDQVAKIIDNLRNEPIRKVSLQVKPHLLYKPNLNDIKVLPDPSATFELFDRVVIARDQYSVPLGLRGTIISILPRNDPNPIRQENINVVDYIYEILFDEPFELGTSIPDIAEKRVFKVRKSVLINITHGAGRPIKEQRSFGMTQRQKNGAVNEPLPPQNAWRVKPFEPRFERKEVLAKDVLVKPSEPPKSWRVPDNKALERKENDVTPVNVNPVEPPTAEFELINLADKVNARERQMRTISTEEDVLKKMLGLSQNKSLAESQPNGNGNINNDMHRIDLNALFGKAEKNATDLGNGQLPLPLPTLSNLPKPPASWHQKSKNNETNNASQQFLSQLQQPSQQHPLYAPNVPMNIPPPQMHHQPFFPPHMLPPTNMMPYGHEMFTHGIPPPPHVPPHVPPYMYRPPMYMQAPNYPMHQMMPVIPGPQPFNHQQIRMSAHYDASHYDASHRQMNEPTTIKHNSPEGPQKLKPKNGTSSAFIPLQAARKGIKGKSNANTDLAAKQDTNLDKSTEEDKNVQSPEVEILKNNGTPAKAVPQIKQKSETKNKENKKDASNFKPPPKRLACNFSVTNN
ncbi:5'-3' exoribonuclease 1 [Contarinia nasturtii]|uniref:5'-3' exoribonuclease 1 n=1 Tax=Contarinia nasturtii TaxID=265458 RepID=UPI0012D4B263|nr:5'-3' exoribonuclease 1 [Contarinia nasturtii]